MPAKLFVYRRYTLQFTNVVLFVAPEFAFTADNFVFTLNGFGTMAELLKRVQDKDKMEDIPKKLPILITAGKEDPVGDYGEAPMKLFDIYKKQLQLENVELKLYDGMRHELQQEIGREQVFADQYEWLKKVIDSVSKD